MLPHILPYRLIESCRSHFTSEGGFVSGSTYAAGRRGARCSGLDPYRSANPHASGVPLIPLFSPRYGRGQDRTRFQPLSTRWLTMNPWAARMRSRRGARRRVNPDANPCYDSSGHAATFSSSSHAVNHRSSGCFFPRLVSAAKSSGTVRCYTTPEHKVGVP